MAARRRQRSRCSAGRPAALRRSPDASAAHVRKNDLPPASVARQRLQRQRRALRASSPITRSIGLPSWVPLVSAIATQALRRFGGDAGEGLAHECLQRREQRLDLRREGVDRQAALRRVLTAAAAPGLRRARRCARSARRGPRSAGMPAASASNTTPQSCSRCAASRSPKVSTKPASRSALVTSR